MNSRVGFKKNLGVFICSHVYMNTRPILFVVHDEGDWQCLCGESDHDNDGHVVGMGHLIDRDPSLSELCDLPDGWEAERKSPQENWRIKKCEQD